ncbi:UDP-4-amino-4,6-dideoxy-N-acetyl-beta-L-altrosamine transaminase [Marinicauda pacifica]|jgi:UDP-4-amino-4,6-dideoxy-N-acetyl-beta-L-altrosamine transaminase|uniref:UDP-4-amino-4, 6-dideoxy-N-acetyl-beta-L-altrosamine transaminase n=1 Tax=Marinicauda pacifica TaxID=1133559 RepID=A0A4S2HCQ7_9PROT|nr:UDP-4-amino-4,6-dideoxy-N-acetyl-beta-L-altrosamine transaminase [Marinicauda pacifica]TGY93835.1 UDP-4-amino-4,6-dideoxy-N-acetyl-beta-L-altrosamine transaminase [Marinicauda pacifica]GGE30736.1 UDP-4-amino-4,6-dideoxy-N-acetyl-beta-L-altrosamine transaminase [Marinicauda pacifica]
MSDGYLPYGRQSIDQDDIDAVTRALQSDYLTTGPEISAFEAEFAQTVASPNGVACNSATAALHMAYDGLGLRPGDAVIVPAVTFLATANAARFCGADVVFCDVDPETGLMTPDTLREALARAQDRVRLVAPVHLGGVMCAMEDIAGLARPLGLAIVEDSCHALASLDEAGQPAGACPNSDAATFSFHPVKTLACGEGGMVTTRDAALAERMRLTRSHGMVRDGARLERAAGAQEPWWYEMQALGWNYRMPDINAALGRSQLTKLSRFAQRRRDLSSRYDALLTPLSPHVQPPAGRPGIDACRHLYNVRIDFEALDVTRTELMRALSQQGVGTQVHYIPVSDQPYYKALYGEQRFEGADRYYARTLSLPLYPAMDDGDPERVVTALKAVLGL